MPNWVNNYLDINGSKEDLQSIKDQLNTPFVRQHDNYNMETKQMEAQDVTFSNPIFAFWNIIKPTNLEAYSKQPDYSLPMEEQLKFQGDDWYSWNTRNWGTKWDVAVSDDTKYATTYLTAFGDDLLAYSYETAWSPAILAVEHLSKQYPNCVFTLAFVEEQGWGGEVIFRNGDMEEVESYDWKCFNCDHKYDEFPELTEDDENNGTCPNCREEVTING
jgi:hypothetical protein